MAVSVIALFVSLLTIFECCSGNEDPCVSYLPLARAAYRGGNCSAVYGKMVCDSRMREGWYRATGITGDDLDMQTTPAGFQTCGTKFPLWMNGTHPTVAENEVTRTVCLTDVVDYDCSYAVKVKNCSGFYVYKLNKTTACPLGYCFGENKPCPPFDPCDVYGHVALPENDPSRSIMCSSDSSKCDEFNNKTWYRLDEVNISTICPRGPAGCGAPSSLWITETNSVSPSENNHVVCVKDSNGCCSSKRVIRSKNCGHFRVYNFGNVPAFPCQRFCTGEGRPCPATTVVSPPPPSPGVSESGSTTGTTPAFKENPTEAENTDSSTTILIPGLVVGVIIGATVGALVAAKITHKRGKKIGDSTLLTNDSILQNHGNDLIKQP